MSAVIFLEGGAIGADSKEINARCREGFRKLLDKWAAGRRWRMPRLVACGGRDSVFEDFARAHRIRAGGDYVAMWIDSEEPMNDPERAWVHLRNIRTVSPWVKPREAQDDQVLFMTTCMETWIVADRQTLKEHFGPRLQESALVPLADLEARDRHTVQDALAHATRKCANAYRKGRKSFEVVGKLAPAALQKHLPSFRRAHRILAAKLRQGQVRQRR